MKKFIYNQKHQSKENPGKYNRARGSLIKTICGFTGDDENLLKKMAKDTQNQTHIDDNFCVSAPEIAVDQHGTVLAYNGTINNREELTNQATGDAEILLNLYKEDGDKFINKINGAFALVIWSPPDGLVRAGGLNNSGGLFGRTVSIIYEK